MASELPIEVLNTPTDVASGQHMVEETVFSVPNDAPVEEEEEELTKEALGLLDIPSSLHGGEVLDFPGVPQNPGLKRDEGDDEETDYFGAAEEGVDLPPENHKHQDTLGSAETSLPDNEFIQFVFGEHLRSLASTLQTLNKNEELAQLKSIIKGVNNSEPSGEKIYRGARNPMINELEKLETLLRNAGKTEKADSVAELKKQADWQGAAVGAGVGTAAGVVTRLLPGLNLIPMPVYTAVGGLTGHALQEYFQSRPQEMDELERQKDVVVELQRQLETQYGVTTEEVGMLSSGKLNGTTLIDKMAMERRQPSLHSLEGLRTLADRYVAATKKLTEIFERPSKEPMLKDVLQPPKSVEEQPGQVASPARTEQEPGPIRIPGDETYTYKYVEDGDYFEVASGPNTGFKMPKGSAGYAKIMAEGVGEGMPAKPEAAPEPAPEPAPDEGALAGLGPEPEADRTGPLAESEIEVPPEEMSENDLRSEIAKRLVSFRKGDKQTVKVRGTPFRAEPRQVKRWIEKNFGEDEAANLRAADAIMKTQSPEYWKSLVKLDADARKEGGVSDALYSAIYNELRRYHKDKENRKSRRERAKRSSRKLLIEQLHKQAKA